MGEETLPSTQKQIIEQAKFTYPPLGKAFQKQRKTIEDQGKKILKTFITQETELLNYIIIMLTLCLKLCIKQNRGEELKY